jgi:microcystin-dependent protein
MAQPYVGEIRMFAGNFNPAGWMFCEGQLLPIGEYETLFYLIGTTYGGDGQSTFALPDLRGRLPIHFGTDSGGYSYALAQMGGVETVTLTVSQIPAHSHTLLATSNVGSDSSPANNYLSMSGVTGQKVYTPSTPTLLLDPNIMTPTGGNQPHNNLQPYLCLNFIISLFGIFPSQN